jgi:eukaryotic-like serine/threonine-protein kinase
MLWIRRMDEVTARPLPGTENANDPFWSPDSRWIGFFSGDKLKKTPAEGGPVQVIANIGNNRGATWGPDDTILFAPGNAGIFRITASGGTATPVTVRGLICGRHRFCGSHFPIRAPYLV